MSSDQITGILRALLAAIGGFVLAKGWVSSATWDWIVGGLLLIGPIIWSWITNRPASMAAKVNALPGVTVTASPAASPDIAAAVKP